MVLVLHLPAEPSRHRVAVWRELRRIGALMLGQGVWVAPATSTFQAGVERAMGLARRGGGDVLLLAASGHDEVQASRLVELFTAAREAEWGEFLSDCGKYEDEIAREIASGKFTLAELDEEDQSLDRLRRWYRELRSRDVFGAASARIAEERLKACADRLDDYASQVYTKVREDLV
jgi:hypothetical protein